MNSLPTQGANTGGDGRAAVASVMAMGSLKAMTDIATETLAIAKAAISDDGSALIKGKGAAAD